MKPSIILYKALPDDLLHRLEEHFTVTRVPNLRPETVAQHAEAFANAEGLLGSSEAVNTALLEKMPKLRATSTRSATSTTRRAVLNTSAITVSATVSVSTVGVCINSTLRALRASTSKLS